MKKAKIIAAMLVLAFSVSLFGGCAKSGEEQTSVGSETGSETKTDKKDDKKDDKKELETLTILYPGDETDRMSDFLDNEFAERMATDLGLKLEMVFVPWDQYWTQKDIMLAANEPIDLYWDGLPSLSTMVNKKQAMPLNDLIDQYGQDMLKVLPMEQIQGAMIKGDIYGIPSAYAPSSAMFQLVCVRQDILEAVGMSDLNTPEDLMEFATKAKEMFPQMKGPADYIFKPLTRYYQDEHYSWVAGEDVAVLGEDSKKIFSYYETEAFQELAKFNREMYLAGNYTDELTINYNERDSRMQTGLYLWVEGSLGKDTEIINAVKANDPNARLKTYLLAEEDPRYIISAGGEVLCIPQTAPNAVGAMKFINWMYSSQENYLFALYGTEGVDYEIVDGRINKIESSEFFYEWMFRNQNYQLFTPDVEQEYIDVYQAWDDKAIPSNVLGFSFNNESVLDIETRIKEVTGKILAPVRSGFIDFETEYPAAIEKLKEAGVDEYIAEVQRQYDEFLASK